MNSLSPAGKAKVSAWRQQFTFNRLKSGVALLKVIVRESQLDTSATISTMRTQLSSLDSYVRRVGCDIDKLNQHVKELAQELYARGETTNDLLNKRSKISSSSHAWIEKRMHMRKAPI
mmetsp:Transcript_31163/g.47541  ORF Transcript_31163/g.47541 Transcript_31163/m.47541 type:complete len:118 (+) Transcript_31163:174-527(+)